jgi:hypothetical protein
MSFFRRVRRASQAAAVPLYTELGPKVAEAASTFAILDGLGGGAPAPASRRGSDKTPQDEPAGEA